MNSAAVQPRKVGPYRVEDRLGAGGMGEVYRGYDERLERPVALKHIQANLMSQPGALARFRREAKTIARLNHPVIVQIYDWVETDDGCWYVMELVTGATLKDVFAEGPLMPAEAVSLGSAIADGLAAAHEAGVSHRDLKPANVMITQAGRVKILDFGLSKSFYSEREESLTDDGKVVGTASAMSPEQALAEPVDERSDLFSLGSLLYEAAVGESPFRQGNAVRTLARICSEPHKSVIERYPAVSRELSGLLDELLEKEPDRRPDSAAAVVVRLAKIANQLARDASDVSTTDLGGRLKSLTESVTLAVVPGSRSGETHETRSLQIRPGRSHPRRSRSGRPRPGSNRSSDSYSRPTSERRQVTVVSAELVTADGEDLDVEDLYELLPELEGLALELDERWGGHAKKIFDHRLVICFGYPVSQEDEARRAVHAALELVDRISGLTAVAGLPGSRLAVRVGLDTGLAVVAADQSGERLVLGRILDRVGAVREAADTGVVFLSAETEALVERYVECRREEPIQLPGSKQARAVYGVREIRDFAAAGPDLELVARREELALLLGRWRTARTGDGQVVLVTGVAGIGKSRLARELTAELVAEGAEHLILDGAPDAGSSSLWPVARLLLQILEIDSAAAEPDELSRLEAFLSRRDLEPAEHVPYLAPLLSLPASERYPAPDLAPRRLQETVLEVLLAPALEGPMVLVVEDLHWLDPSTLELVGRLLAEIEALPVLAVLTFRP